MLVLPKGYRYVDKKCYRMQSSSNTAYCCSANCHVGSADMVRIQHSILNSKENSANKKGSAVLKSVKQSNQKATASAMNAIKLPVYTDASQRSLAQSITTCNAEFKNQLPTKRLLYVEILTWNSKWRKPEASESPSDRQVFKKQIETIFKDVPKWKSNEKNDVEILQ